MTPDAYGWLFFRIACVAGFIAAGLWIGRAARELIRNERLLRESAERDRMERISRRPEKKGGQL